MFATRTRTSKIALQVIATLMAVPFLLPLIAMVQGSLAGRGFRNYVLVWETGVLLTYLRNSVIISVFAILIVYVATMLAAFGFSKLRIRGKEFYFWALLLALTMPEAVLLTPLFITASTFDMYNQLIAVILPVAALQIPFATLLARNFYDGIPSEIIEAARVDGANIWQVFRRVVLPLTKPIAAAIVVLTLIAAWNAYLIPLLMLNDPQSQVLTLLPSFFVSQWTNDQTGVLAAAVIAAIPMIIAYLALQKYFERGLSAGALK
ncbi:MAG: carbohydrate ABC transporter permease [Promicromonosporaceae bacterium]|nr:carbohydrate ABC transporter permease [Promicromonosporaceae bacterium]